MGKKDKEKESKLDLLYKRLNELILLQKENKELIYAAKISSSARLKRSKKELELLKR